MHYLPQTIPDEAADALRPAFDRSYTDYVETWLEACRRDEAQLWRRNQYWAITRVISALKTGEMICHQVASAGEFDGELLNEIEAWAKSKGCVKMVADVRPGLTRRVDGYAIKAVTVEKGI
ncbi:hypothetical protein [Acidovorax sp.]|uniref:hypothetical protein n=1 Tax=Acidovorax sp. TaxID=1872122 RepID=UPI0031CDDB98